MLFLRITPTLPNLFINLASPIVDVPFHIFFLATLIGLIPASYITVRVSKLLCPHLTVVCFHLILISLLLLALIILPICFCIWNFFWSIRWLSSYLKKKKNEEKRDERSLWMFCNIYWIIINLSWGTLILKWLRNLDDFLVHKICKWKLSRVFPSNVRNFVSLICLYWNAVFTFVSRKQFNIICIEVFFVLSMQIFLKMMRLFLLIWASRVKQN